MPYVACPSCSKVGHVPPSRTLPSLCPNCGEPLPARREVVTLSRYRRLIEEQARESALPAAA